MPFRKKGDKSYHHGNLATDLLEAVEHLATKFDLDAVTLRACAKLLNVAPSAGFRHYRDKRALLTAYATWSLKRQCEEINHHLEQGSANPKQAVALGYLQFALKYPRAFQAVWRRELISPDDEHYREAMVKVEQKIEMAMPDHSEDQRLAFWSGLQGLASLMIDGPFDGKMPPERLDAIVTHLIERLG